MRRFHRAQRRRQLDLLAALRRPPRSAAEAKSRRTDDAVLLFTLERTLDAVAEGETAALGLDETAVIDRLPDELSSGSAARLTTGAARGG